MGSTYLRFMELVQSLGGVSPQLEQIDETAKQLLTAIAVRHQQGKILTVSEAMNMASIASPATIHVKLTKLLDAKLVEQVFEGKNRRTKYLVPTEQANIYFASLSEVMEKAIASSSYGIDAK